jgi:hypothetical protein
MKSKFSFTRRFKHSFLIFLSVFLLGGLSSYSQEMKKMDKDSSSVQNKNKNVDKPAGKEEEKDLPDPFFSHMGMPEAVGTYSMRFSALSSQIDGKSVADFAFHIEIGLSKIVGLHIRNDRFLANPASEIMFQFLVLKSKDGMSGFAPIIEFEIPTHTGEKRINTLVGFTSTLANSRVAFDQILHYNPREDMVDGSFALIYKLSKKLFFVTELLGEKARGETTALNLLGGLKFKISELLTIGFGYQHSIAGSMGYNSQYIFQPGLEFKNQKL